MTNEVALPNGDGWGSVPQSGGGLVKGKLLLFKKGRFYLDKVELRAGVSAIAIGVVVCWIAWRDGRPAETLVTLAGQPHPDRKELGDLEPSKWPVSPISGKPEDPWKDTRLLYLADEQSAKVVTFTTSTYGGRRAVGEQIATFRYAHPGAVPKVRLEAAEFRSRTFGLVSLPSFVVESWLRSSSEMQPLEQLPAPAAADVDDGMNARRFATTDMNDVIPFAPEWR